MTNYESVLNNHVLLDESFTLLPTVLIRSGRLHFRRIFIKQYPSFIYTLRGSIPQITAGEEILCMLIFLKQNTDDISSILGICRKSVKQSRYRLRRKMKISVSVSIEEFVHKLFSDEPSACKSVQSTIEA